MWKICWNCENVKAECKKKLKAKKRKNQKRKRRRLLPRKNIFIKEFYPCWCYSQKPGECRCIPQEVRKDETLTFFFHTKEKCSNLGHAKFGRNGSYLVYKPTLTQSNLCFFKPDSVLSTEMIKNLIERNATCKCSTEEGICLKCKSIIENPNILIEKSVFYPSVEYPREKKQHV